MRKSWSVVASILVSVFLFASCAAPSAEEQKQPPEGTQSSQQAVVSPEKASNPNEIVMEIIYGGGNWLKYAAEKFEEKTGVKVKIVDRFEDGVNDWIEVPDDSLEGHTTVSVGASDYSKYRYLPGFQAGL